MAAKVLLNAFYLDHKSLFFSPGISAALGIKWSYVKSFRSQNIGRKTHNFTGEDRYFLQPLLLINVLSRTLKIQLNN